MAIRELFWFLAGIASAVAALVVVVPLWRASPGSQPLRTRLLLPTGLAVIVIAAAVVLYMRLGAPRALDARPAAAAEPPPHAAAGPAGEGAPAGSLEAAAGQLAQRLQRDGGTAADWELLAQSYDFLGRTADAVQARAQARAAPATTGALATGESTAPATGAAAAKARAMAAPPVRLTGKAGELRNRAEQQRRARDFAGAVATFAELAKLSGMDADAWADYADALAATQKNSLAGRPGDLLAQALKLDPDHPKALWLQASLYLETKDYPRALAAWQRLAAVLPPDSPDARIVAANVAETRRLAGLPAGLPAGVPAAATAGARIEADIDLAPSLRTKTKSGTPLYVYAKAVDSPGPPLAVLRVATGSWPLRVALDDSMAMMPERRLSGFSAVTVEARISASGEAAARPGDLQGRSAPLDPRRTRSVRVLIDRPAG